MAAGPMLTLDDAQTRLLALVSPLATEWVDIDGAFGRYLTEPLLARRTQPTADLSAMDGYAVRAADIAGPWLVIGESAAGHPFSGSVASSEAVRISTGAIVPRGADCIVMQEDVHREGSLLRLTGTPPAPPARHVRKAGMDFCKGAVILEPGTALGAAQIALAVSAGHGHLPVARIARVAVIDSGDELAPDPAHCGPHQIPASNGVMLCAMVRSLPVQTTRIGPVPDTTGALLAALDRCHDADVIVTSGGASVGDHDLVRPALEAWGASLDFWKVAIQPGKPILVAQRRKGQRSQLIVGLPGNPVSSFVTAYLFLLPLLRGLAGAAAPLPRSVTVKTATRLPANGQRRQFLRAVWDGRHVTPVAVQDSGALAALAAGNALIDRPAQAPAVAAGAEVPIFLL